MAGAAADETTAPALVRDGHERTDAALRRLVGRFDLDAHAESRLRELLRMVAEDPFAPTRVRDPRDIVDQHLADSLVALEFAPVRTAGTIVDLGSGAGFPGLPLSIARQDARLSLIESSSRRCEFLRRVVARCGLANVSVVNARAESWPEGVGRFELATARAVAELDVVIEYGAPLLAVGGWLVVWRGRRDAEAERRARRASEVLGMRVEAVVRVTPFAGARDRHLHLIVKVRQTPPGFPRRPGAALKRPLGGRVRPRGGHSCPPKGSSGESSGEPRPAGACPPLPSAAAGSDRLRR